MDWNFLCGQPNNSTNWFSVHCSALGQQLSTELCSTLQEHCGQAPLLFALECSAPTLCTGATAFLSTVQQEHSLLFFAQWLLCTNSVEQAQVYFVEQELSSTLWCAAGPTTHSLDTETLDREGPIFMVMCHFWHRGTGWGLRICCFSTKGFQQSQGTEIL